jgi:hypothetical protein
MSANFWSWSRRREVPKVEWSPARMTAARVCLKSAKGRLFHARGRKLSRGHLSMYTPFGEFAARASPH